MLSGQHFPCRPASEFLVVRLVLFSLPRWQFFYHLTSDAQQFARAHTMRPVELDGG